jgi:flagellar hook assembly protein FlgD
MPPANLYVNFADGPGIYQLAIYDSQGQLIRSIYQKRAINESDDWAVWDGKNESGRDALPGYYRVLFTLNGVRLKDVIIHLVAGNP